MTGEDFINMLDGVRQTSRGWTACCPAHDDSNPSLSISLGNDGRILVYCFAGCPVQEICKALGLQVRDLFSSNKRDPKVREKHRRREHERLRKQQQWQLKGFQIDVIREAECLIQSACGIDISTWGTERLNRELDRLACAYATFGKESRYE